jgi:hypothetical protein
MEEVIGWIPIRYTYKFKHLEAPPFRDLVANPKTAISAGFGPFFPRLSETTVAVFCVRLPDFNSV